MEGQNSTQRWDCSQIENEEEEESWQEGDQMTEQLEEKQHLEDIIEIRRIAGSSLKLDAMHKKYLSWWSMNECHKVKGCKLPKKRRKYQGGQLKK